MTSLPLILAAFIGFQHAFEADHVLAVGNLANQRKSIRLAIKDGLFWGLGHTSTIFVVGCVIILGKLAFEEKSVESFAVLEAVVGATLIALGAYRLSRLSKYQPHTHDHKGNGLAYSIGLLHGLAGSGAVALVAVTELETSMQGIAYLLLFGAGSVVGMMITALLFKIPLNLRVGDGHLFAKVFIGLSGLLCLAYGVWMIIRFAIGG